MKNIKYLFLVAILAFTVSCENDGFEPVEATLTSTTQIKVGFSDTNNAQTVVEGDMLTYTVMLSNAATQDITVEFAVSSSDGSSNGEVSFTNPLVIPAGATSVDVPVTFNDDGVVDTAETYTISISNITPVLNNAYILTGNSTRTATVEQAPTVVTTTAGDVDITLTWSEASRDMDLYLVTGDQDLNGTIVDRSLGFTTTEKVTFPSAQTDGIYSVYINQYAFTADVDYTMTFDFPGGQQEVFSSTVTMDSFVFTIEKVTNGSDVTYTIKQL